MGGLCRSRQRYTGSCQPEPGFRKETGWRRGVTIGPFAGNLSDGLMKFVSVVVTGGKENGSI